jgi:BirA family transcriptional regulator, biotin operon repressor / biotin---[acetyl-CoA-carboxylase] ligase
VEVSPDLSLEALERALPGRALRSYPALLSTDADAVAWARAGAPAGAVVVADYQAAPRGRGGLPWACEPGRDLGFSLVLRPPLSPDDEGWLYVAAALGVLEALGGTLTVDWPDRIERDDVLVAEVAGHAGLGAHGVEWAVVNVLVHDAPEPRSALLARLVDAIERVQEPDPQTLTRYRERCTTLGREVVARLIPVWPDGVRISGRATSVLTDGALLIAEEPAGRRMAVRPQHLARLDTPPPPGAPG